MREGKRQQIYKERRKTTANEYEREGGKDVPTGNGIAS
jgi:hypothetical protein